jgi:hypothetical protein
MTTFTMRGVGGDFVVTGPDIEPKLDGISAPRSSIKVAPPWFALRELNFPHSSQVVVSTSH